MNQEKKLVTLWERPSYDGKGFTYYLLYTDEIGHRRQKSLGHCDSRKAERQRAAFERHLRIGNVEPGSLTLEELLKDYLERTRTQIEESTAYSASYRMKDLVAAVGNIRADKVTYQHVERFQQYCIDRGLSPASVNTHIKMVKRIFSLAVKRGQIEKNPFNGISLLKVPQGLIRLIALDEFQQLMNSARENIWKARILLAKTSGLRRGEILNLTVNDVDFAKGKIIVQPKLNTKCTWRWVVKDKDRREVPLVSETAELLMSLRESLSDGQPYFFLTSDRYKYLMHQKTIGSLIDRVAKCPDNNFRRNWNLICKRACVENATFHDLRATCITEWFERGMMPHEIQKLAGHSSIETTMKYYVGYRETIIDRARQASSAALNGKSVANLLQYA